MTEDRKGYGDIISTLTIAVLFIVILLLVVFSAASYQHATEIQNKNNRERALRTYVVSCIRENSASEVDKRDFDGAPGIVISTAGSGFERRIYLKGGKLLEEYVESDRAPSPDSALVVGETEKFEVSLQDDGLIKIETDCGVSYAHTGV